MQKISLLALLTAALLLFACQPQQQATEEETEAVEAPAEITLTKLEGSAQFPEASLSLTGDPTVDEEGKYTFEFEVEGYELGAQTPPPMSLANSGKGQHIHFIVDNGPYAAHYEPSVVSDKLSEPGNHVVLAFLSRSYHESVKNVEEPTSYFVGQFATGDSSYEDVDFTAPHLFYSRPKGTYTGEGTKNLLLDFFVLNATLSEGEYMVRATINGTEFTLTEWAPYVINGLPMGEATIMLELLDAEGNFVPGPFNKVERTVTLEAAAE